MLPFISVVIPVRNERAMLPKLLDQLIRQNYPPDLFEVLVVDGHSTDGTADLVRRRYSKQRVRIQVLDNPGIRSSAGRNIGIRAARGGVVVFIDGHCTAPSPNLLEDTAAILGQTGAGCLCRPQPLLAPAATPAGEAIAFARAHWLGHGRDSLIYDMQKHGFVDPASSGATYVRSVFERVGMYDESFDACEDVELNTRVRKAGIRAYTDPRLAVYYQPRKNVRGLFRQMMRYGRGRIRLMRKHPDTFSKATLAPLALLLALAVVPLAWMLLPRMAAGILSVPAALFAAIVAVASLQLAFRHGIASAWRAPRIFTAIYCGLGVGLLAEILMPAKPAAPAPVVLDVLRPGQELEVVEQANRAA
ncbi:MAG: glycosyltransferase family 2 protein [Acidobacteriaceae bacterium]